MIELIDFGKDYGDFTAVGRLNLKIEAGEMFAFTIGQGFLLGVAQAGMVKAVVIAVHAEQVKPKLFTFAIAASPDRNVRRNEFWAVLAYTGISEF